MVFINARVCPLPFFGLVCVPQFLLALDAATLVVYLVAFTINPDLEEAI